MYEQHPEPPEKPRLRICRNHRSAREEGADPKAWSRDRQTYFWWPDADPDRLRGLTFSEVSYQDGAYVDDHRAAEIIQSRVR